MAYMADFLNPYVENSVTTDLIGIVLKTGKKQWLNIWGIGKKPIWVCHFVLLYVSLIGQQCVALSQADGPFIGNINNYWHISRTKGIAVHVLLNLDLLCHDMFNLIDDMFTASCLSWAADGWSQLEAWTPRPGLALFFVLMQLPSEAGFHQWPELTGTQSITVTWGLAQQIAARLDYFPI